MRRVTRHVQAISKEISEISSPARYSLDQETIYTLVTLLSYSLRAAIPNNDSATEMFNCDVAEPALESGLHKENIKNAAFPSNCRKPETSSGVKLKRRSISPRQAVQLVSDILETASDLMLVRNNMSSSTNELKSYPHLLLNRFFCLFSPEVHLVSQGPGAPSQHWPYCFICHAPKPNLHSHQQWLSCLPHARLADPASVRSSQGRN